MDGNKVLIVDDAEINREILKDIFQEQYEILMAEDGEIAITLLKQYHGEICVVFLDLMMPRKNGIEVLEFMNAQGYMERIPVIMITGEATPEFEERAYELGTSDVIYKPFSQRVVMRRTMNIIQLFENRRNIEEQLEIRTEELRESQAQMLASQEKLHKTHEFLINALGSVVEFRGLETSVHIKRVRYFVKKMMENYVRMYPECGLGQDAVNDIVAASALHDIGKVAIPDSILFKHGELTKEETEKFQRHTILGCEILENFKRQDDDFYRYCYDIVRHHHERYDGMGYPEHLRGDNIPVWAEIVGLCDAFDDLVSKRVYKDAYPTNTAAAMILAGECGAFSPGVLECFSMVQPYFFEAVENEFVYS